MKAFWRLAGKTAGLLGFGRSNQTLLEFLLLQGMTVTIHDKRPISRPDLAARGVRFCTGDGYLDNLYEDYLFRSPGIRPDEAPILSAIARGAILSGEYDLFASLCPATMLGITGSDGKTTTTTIAGLILKASGRTAYVGGNIGNPLIGNLLQMQADDVAVAELSSFQLMTAPRPPHRAVITNLTENHLNWHRDMTEYADAKAKILGPATHAILNADNPYTAALARRRADKTLFSRQKNRRALLTEFGTCHTITAENGMIFYDEVPLLAVSDILLPGGHNQENYMAAIGLVYPYATQSAMRQVAQVFGGVPHRLQLVADRDGVRYYNSSIDSTPSRTAATLAALQETPIVLCGGADKGLSLTPLYEALDARAKAVILFGAARERLREALRGLRIPLEIYKTMAEAVRAAKEMAKPGDCILLSPACTSFDAFSNFEERGEAFIHEITKDERLTDN